MAFDPTTAYHNDWAYIDRVEDVSWERPTEAGTEIVTGFKARFGAIDTPDLVRVAAGLSLSTDAAAVVLWEIKPDDVAIADWAPTFAPEPGHILRRGAAHSDEGWLIKAIARSPLQAKWNLLVDKEVVNA